MHSVMYLESSDKLKEIFIHTDFIMLSTHTKFDLTSWILFVLGYLWAKQEQIDSKMMMVQDKGCTYSTW